MGGGYIFKYRNTFGLTLYLEKSSCSESINILLPPECITDTGITEVCY
jgi:hypothetical protein